MHELRKEGNAGRKSFALIVRGDPRDFTLLLEQAKCLGVYVVFSKTSSEKLVVQEVPW